MKIVVKVLASLACLVFVIGVAAGEKLKPWTEWSMKDAHKILEESGWGQTQIETDTSQMTFSAGRSSSHQATSVRFRICFLSAKPVRQAFARLAELDKGVNTPEQIKSALAFIDAKFSDKIVVAVDYWGGDGRMTGYYMTAFSSAITNTLRNTTYLELKGGKRLFLQEYQTKKQGGVGYMFIFPRLVDGKPFIDPSASEVRFYSELPEKALTLNMRFKIANLMYDGVLEY